MSQEPATLEFTGERVLPDTGRDVLQQSLLAFHQALYNAIAPHCTARTVLDLGCGSGHGSMILQRHAAQVWGMDIAPEALHFAANRMPPLAGRLFVGDSQALAFPDEQFDVVCAIEVIEHVADAALLLSEIRRILRPGGKCFISTPNRLVFSPGSTRPLNPFHVVEYTYDTFAALFGELFADVTIQCIYLRQRSFLVRYQRAALPFHLPFPLNRIERFCAWHLPFWNQRALQPHQVILAPHYRPNCSGFLSFCTRPHMA
jgi:ubiquinone/menaquinone biosynthesis C-methylase UbiE